MSNWAKRPLQRLRESGGDFRDQNDVFENRRECPTCGRTMFKRTNKQTKTPFWGCSGYPDDCRETFPID
jgi:ssDNA-binding Zn-finger/Zn-ribbon topoisomerase 1